MDNMENIFMDPTGATEDATNHVAVRPETLDGVTVGLLWNRKYNGDKLLKSIGVNVEIKTLPIGDYIVSVSYTHLTLPTILLV